MLKGKTRYVSILSDDSDFATLFSVLKQETALTDESKVPFMWFMTDRPNTRSSMLNDFFPSEYVHIVTCASRSANHDEKGHEIQTDGKPKDERDSIARFIIRNTTIGPFKSADCKKLIAKNFPKNPLAKLDSAPFGTQFSETIWPILEQYGVKSQKPSRGPRKYEMTEEAKRKVN